MFCTGQSRQVKYRFSASGWLVLIHPPISLSDKRKSGLFSPGFVQDQSQQEQSCMQGLKTLISSRIESKWKRIREEMWLIPLFYVFDVNYSSLLSSLRLQEKQQVKVGFL